MTKRMIFHVAAAAVTVLLLLMPIVHDLLSPVDVFAHANFLLVSHLQFLLAALIFYGFSLALFGLMPLPTAWSVGYTATSWLFFLWAFYPSPNNSGMMRRIAVTWDEYLAAERLREQLHCVAMFIFGCIQLAYLIYVFRRVKPTVQP